MAKKYEDLIREIKILKKRIAELEKNPTQHYLSVAGNMFIVLNKDGVVTLANKKATEVLGYPESEILGRNWFEHFLPKNQVEKVKNVFDNICSGKLEPLEFYENPVINAEGNERIIAWHNSILKNDNGTFYEILSSGVDVTETRQAEEALRESENKYRSILDNTSQAVFIKDLEGKYLYINKVFEQLHQITNAEIQGLTDFDIFSKDQATQFRKHDKAVIAEKKPLVLEEFVPHPDGMHTVLSSKIPLYNNDGTIYAVCGIATDITPQKKIESKLRESEEKFRSYIEDAPDGVFVADDNGKYKEVNQAACKITGYTKKELLSMGITDLLHPEDIEKGIQHFSSLANDGYASAEIRFVTKKGEIRFWTVDAVKISTDRFLGFVKDITVRKTAELALSENRNELSHLLNSMINAFVIFESVFDKSGKFISYRFEYINKAYEDITGVKNNEVKGKTVHEVWPETEPEWIKRYGNVALTGKTDTFELFHEPTGKLYHCRVYRPWDNNKKFCVIFEDITQQKQAEIKLKESEEKHRVLLESAGAGIGYWDLNGKLILFNNLAAKLMGGKPEDFVGKNIRELYGDAVYLKYMDRLKLAAGSTKSKDYEDQVQLQEGTKWFLSTYTRILGNNKQVKGIQIISKDITDRKLADLALKESEAKFKGIFEHSNIGIVLSDNEGNILEVNKEFLALLGHSREDIIKMNIRQFTHPDDMPFEINMVNKIISGEINDFRLEKRYIHKNGEIMWADLALTSRKNAQGKIDMIIGMVMDVTRQKKAAEEIKKHHENLEKLVAERTTELEKKNEELMRFNKLFIGREFRIKELRDKLKELENKIKESEK
ncbi:MAG: PAS domain S-box protein [Bacteroidales bacterium]|nr:PAS domain S-box protein [Bacteroidales bacterium]MCF8404312.1 PAS domain S-box protein [Bacteroidales bacterium]